MRIKTKFFGEIDIKDEQAILFPYGIYGFEEYTRFVLLYDNENEQEYGGGHDNDVNHHIENTGNNNVTEAVFGFLQCADDENLCFTVVDPKFIDGAYSPKLPPGCVKQLNIVNTGDLMYLAIAVISDNLVDSTVNMQGPIVVNSKNMIGAQVILETHEPENAKYGIKQKIFKTQRTQTQEDFAKC